MWRSLAHNERPPIGSSGLRSSERSPLRRAFVWLRANALRAGLVLALALGWFLFVRPYSLGGAVAYIKVAGSSMEPGLRGGDLVITKRHDDYRIGDIIAFRAEGGIVLHRIVGGNPVDGFDTQGDNAPRLDGWRPRSGDVIGKEWVHVPLAGVVVDGLQEPIVLGSLAGGLVAFSVMMGGHPRPRRQPGLVVVYRSPAPAPHLPERHSLRVDDETEERAA